MLRTTFTGLLLKIQTNIPWRRALALFLLAVFVVSVIAPPASAYAVSQPVKTNPHAKGTPPDTTTPMTQNYPSASPAAVASKQAASDAQATDPAAIDQIGKKPK